MAERGTVAVKRGLAQMLKGGVIMGVTTAEDAKIAVAGSSVAERLLLLPQASGRGRRETTRRWNHVDP